MITIEIARLYPQPLILEIRKFFWYNQPPKNKKSDYKKYSFMSEKNQPQINSLGKRIYEIMNEQKATNVSIDQIDSIIGKFKKFSNTKEEELFTIIEKGYEMSFKNDFKAEVYCERIWRGFFRDLKDNSPEFLTETLKNQFNQDFMSEDQSCNKYLKVQEKLKKWKDILSRRISLKLAPGSLVENNKKLANIDYKMGIELPGQYLDLDIEPFPEKRILITKFEPNLFIGGVNKKRIIIRTNTGKRLMYSIFLNHKLYEESTKTDERITHLKVYLNKIFQHQNSETMRKGIRLGIFKKMIFPFTKLYEENNLSSLDEIYKLACSESGIDYD